MKKIRVGRRWSRAAIVLAALLPLAPLAAQQGGDPFERVVEALKSDRFAEALELSRSAAAVAPLDPEAQALYGLALLYWGETERAESALRLALDVDPENADAHLGLGLIAAGFNRYEAAVSHLLSAAPSERFLGEAMLALSRVHFFAGVPDAALRAAEVALDEIDYLSDAQMEELRAHAEHLRSLGNRSLFQVPESFQKTTAELLPQPGGSLSGVDIRINGQRVVRFLLDPACPNFIVVSRRLAERFGLEFAGGGTAMQYSLLDTLEIGTLVVERVPALLLRSPDFADGIEGVIGTGFLRRFNCTIDFRAAYLQLYRIDRPDLLERSIDRSRVAARLPVFSLPAPSVGVSVGGSDPVPFIINTARSTVLDGAYYDVRIAPNTAGARAALGDVAVDLPSISAGGIEAADLRIAVGDLAPPSWMERQRVAGILGIDFFGRYRLHLNFSDSVMTLESAR